MAENSSLSRFMQPVMGLTLLLLLMPAFQISTGLFAETPDEIAHDELFPEGAVLRLGTTRFRQEDEVKEIEYSKDGKTLASIDGDAVVIWDARTGKQLKLLRLSHRLEYVTRFSSMSFSPDGQEIAATNLARVYIWEIETGLELLSFPITSEVGFGDDIQIRHSPDGTQLAVAGQAGVGLYDTTTGERDTKLTIDNHNASFQGVCWTPDGTHVSAGTLEPAVVTWNTETGKLVRRFEAQKGRAFSHCQSLSQDGKTLIGSTASTIHLWQFDTGKHLKDIELDADLFQNIVITPDHKTLIAGSQDGNIHVVNLETGEPLRKIDGGLWIERSMAVSPDFKTVAIGAVFPTIRQWNIETGQEKYPELTARFHDAEVECAAYSPNGHLIASGGPNQQINLWDAATGKLVRKLQSKSSANQLAFTPSGQHLLSSWHYSNLIRVWDVHTGEQLRTIDTGMKRVREFAFTPDAKQLIVVASDSKYGWHSPIGEEAFQVWDFASGEKLREFPFPTASTESLAVSRDGKSLITGSANGTIHVMDLQSGDELARLFGHRHTADSLALTRDGTLLASGSTDQTIRLWNTKTWETIRILKGHNRAVTSVAFSPDGRMLVSGSGKESYPLSPENSQRIRLWEVSSGEQTGEFSGHNTNTSAVAFSPDGQRLVSAHSNTTLLVWDVGQFSER